MIIEIRPAKSSDAESCAKIHMQSWEETYRGIMPDSILNSVKFESRLKMWGKIISEPNIFTFVAEVKGEGIVGYCSGGKNRSSLFPGHGEISGIYLLKKYQGMGIGVALFNRGMRHLTSLGFSKMALWVLTENKTRQFYEKLGGTPGPCQDVPVEGTVLKEISYVWNDIIPEKIFHLTPRKDWETAQKQGYYTHASFEKEGFIHFSSAYQVQKIANWWFKNVVDPVLVEIDPRKLTGQLKYESGGDIEEYPHVYGTIPLDAVISVREYTLNKDSAFDPVRL
ncbi:MAG TPA: GNAT family N-acetyltransferase [Bacteriovoracaceae bacterium]|nr:GNAT family N-acetyltransferase [Bacteriovoracaceae bacterium]